MKSFSQEKSNPLLFCVVATLTGVTGIAGWLAVPVLLSGCGAELDVARERAFEVSIVVQVAVAALFLEDPTVADTSEGGVVGTSERHCTCRLRLGGTELSVTVAPDV